MIKIFFSFCIASAILLGKSAEFKVSYLLDNNISLSFKLNEYDVIENNGLSKVVLDNDREYSKSSEQYSKLIHIDSDYSISTLNELVVSYGASQNNNLNNSSSDYISIKEHIFRGRKLIQISVDPIKYNSESNKIIVHVSMK